MEELKTIINKIKASYKEDVNLKLNTFPSLVDIEELCNHIINLVTLGRCPKNKEQYYTIDCAVDHLTKGIYDILYKQLFLSYRKVDAVDQERIKGDIIAFISELPSIKEDILKDAQWALENDPATDNIDEIILSYPCIVAQSIYRAAHFLYLRDVPFIPRMMSEIAHSRTGIDIHPGATIASPFFIDHGTGTVIGQTCIIKENCKIYQGVTLGAIKIARDGKKRHPTLEKNVTVYASASILGDVIVGENSVVGSNVRLRENVKPNSLVKAVNIVHEVKPLVL